MPELRIDAGGLSHALFVADFFSGSVEGYSATSADTGVATAGVSPPDMLIVSPVSDGSTSVTVTASGPGGAATQTMTVRVGAAGAGGTPTPPPSPSPSAPPPAPAAPPSPAPADDAEPMVPTDELPALSPPPADTTRDGLPLDSLPSEPVTAPPTVSASVPAQTMIVGRSATLNLSSYFTGVVQGWSAESLAPGIVSVSMDVAGVVSLSADSLGNATVTVTATNDLGSAVLSIAVRVRTEAQVVLTLVGGHPQVLVPVGQTASLDLSLYFSEAATAFHVIYNHNDPNRLVDVTMQGSVASIRGLRAGGVTITLVASNASARVERPATIRITQ